MAGFATLGYGLPAAVMAKRSHPERIVAHVDYHLGVARREVGRLVRSLTLTPAETRETP